MWETIAAFAIQLFGVLISWLKAKRDHAKMLLKAGGDSEKARSYDEAAKRRKRAKAISDAVNADTHAGLRLPPDKRKDADRK